MRVDKELLTRGLMQNKESVVSLCSALLRHPHRLCKIRRRPVPHDLSIRHYFEYIKRTHHFRPPATGSLGFAATGAATRAERASFLAARMAIASGTCSNLVTRAKTMALLPHRPTIAAARRYGSDL